MLRIDQPSTYTTSRGLRRQALIVAGLAIGLIATAQQAVSADESPLPVTEGLELRFVAGDAGEDVATGTAAEAPVSSWPESTGRHGAATQATDAAQPNLVRVGGSAVVRFDGVDDHLRLTGIDRDLEGVTLFVVAAARENPGGFRAFLAANQTDRRDFQSGFTVDMGPFATPAFSQLNVEGRGFTGAQSLAGEPSPLGTLHVLEIVIDPAEKNVRLAIDGAPNGTRPYDGSPLRMDELTIGARYYNLGAGPQQVTGFAAADIAEIALYARVLSDDERTSVRERLLSDYDDLKRDLPPTLLAEGNVPLESIADPPPVQMFLPGYEVRELPVELPNINNVRYRADGTLMAVAYDGDVFVLQDTDGDGLEDTARLFWDNDGRVRSPIGMALTPPGYERGDGLFVATKSECLLLADTDGDGVADTETTVATGWAESFHNVDALGVAVDPRDHSIYFGLGAANFTDAYVRDAEGRPTYRLEGERSAILRVSPDFTEREPFCTGIRFTVGLAFNRHGDLFGTDQEGATWVPNGNPFDELLHLEQGRHYGFPARHPEFLPNVIDEPSVYDYGPQHQSTCGLFFNDPVNGGPVFGPESWAGDALVCGYSRGKLYRTKLVKTPLGYVADNRLIACLNMLTVDACVSPTGGLVVAVHSGGPDWGSGPSGKGKLYQVRYVDRSAPQPVAAWAAGTNEVRIAFDQPLELERLQGLAAATRITYGDAVRAGDEFESLRPGYEIVARQMTMPRRELRVHSAQVTPDRRTLILVTDAQTEAMHYAVQLPGLGRPPLLESGTSQAGAPLPQHSRVDVDYSLQGVAARWESAEGTWADWLPHVDLAVARELLNGSAEHAELATLMEQPGRLVLQAQFELSDMLQPAVQPGSKLDYELPPETVTLRFECSAPFVVRTEAGESAAVREGDAWVAMLIHGPEADRFLPMEIEIAAEAGSPQFTAAWFTAEDSRLRAFPLRRMLLPWARPRSAVPTDLAKREIPQLDGGSWSRGRAVFFSEEAACFKCHAVSGQGGTIGPDLSNLIHRDYASVHRDISDPSYAVNPDYITHSLLLYDGRVLTGTLKSQGDQLLVSDTQAQVTTVARSDVEELKPASKSIMPDDVIKRLSPEKLKDLLTYLLMPAPHMPLDGPQDAPRPRSRAEVEAALAGAPDPVEPTQPLRIVLVAGPKDHGPGEHDYPAWQTVWTELLGVAADTSVGTAWEWPSADDLATADVLVFYQHGTWTPDRARDIDAFLARGGGLVYIHYAVDGGQDAPGFAQRIGLAWQGGRSKFRHGPLDLGFETGDGHPISRNLDQLQLVDESYWNLVPAEDAANVLATGVEEGEPQPLFWTLEPSRGRVFVSIPGHFSWTFDDPLYRVLLLRGIAWTAGEPVDRFNELVTIGARMTQ